MPQILREVFESPGCGWKVGIHCSTPKVGWETVRPSQSATATERSLATYDAPRIKEWRSYRTPECHGGLNVLQHVRYSPEGGGAAGAADLSPPVLKSHVSPMV